MSNENKKLFTEANQRKAATLKRFLVFEITNSLDGGWDDYYGSYDTLAEAQRETDWLLPDFWHIVDTQDPNNIIRLK